MWAQTYDGDPSQIPALQPEADKLGALCQFPASFKRDDASVEYLTRLLKMSGDYVGGLHHRQEPRAH